MGHVLGKDECKWVSRVMDINVEVSRPQGRPRKRRINVAEEDVRLRELVREDASG